MNCIIGYDGKGCYSLHISYQWQETSVVYEDIVRSAQEAGFMVKAELKNGHPIKQPECIYMLDSKKIEFKPECTPEEALANNSLTVTNFHGEIILTNRGEV